MPDERIDTNTAPRAPDALDDMKVRLAQILKETDDLGLEYAALKIAEAIDIIENSDPKF